MHKQLQTKTVQWTGVETLYHEQSTKHSHERPKRNIEIKGTYKEASEASQILLEG